MAQLPSAEHPSRTRPSRLVAQIVVGVVVLGLVITMINLGLWQLRRHDERLALRDQLADSLAQPALDISIFGSPAAPGSPDAGRAADLEYRRVEAQGNLWCSQAVLVRNRTLNGRPGYWAMAPLVLEGVGMDDSPSADVPTQDASTQDASTQDADDSAVMVNLGWLPRELASDDICAPTDTDGTTKTALTGLILLPRNGAKKECDSLAPVCTFAQPDIAVMSEHFADTQPSAPQSSEPQPPAPQPSAPQSSEPQSPAPQPSAPQSLSVAPDFYIQLESSTPLASTQLSILGAPEFSLGNHQSYAVQWFIFAAIAAGGYPLMLWRNARRRQNQTPAVPASSPGPDPQS